MLALVVLQMCQASGVASSGSVINVSRKWCPLWLLPSSVPCVVPCTDTVRELLRLRVEQLQLRVQQLSALSALLDSERMVRGGD
jgi:hypothetical protein